MGIRTALSVFALAALTAHCGGRIEPTPTAATGTVTVENATRVSSDDKWLTARVRVANGTAHAAYIYSEYLGTELDESTHLLTLTMHEVPQPPTGSSADCHVRIPKITSIPALTTIDLDVRMPAVTSESDPSSRGIKKHVLTTAARIDVELGWSDRPMALTPDQKSLCVFDAQTALRSIERGVASGTFAF
jgi:hypothetical protein